MNSRAIKIDKKELFAVTKNLKQYIISKPSVKGLHSIYKYRGCTITIYDNMSVLLQGINIALVYKNLFEAIDISNIRQTVQISEANIIKATVNTQNVIKPIINKSLVGVSKPFIKEQNKNLNIKPNNQVNSQGTPINKVNIQQNKLGITNKSLNINQNKKRC